MRNIYTKWEQWKTDGPTGQRSEAKNDELIGSGLRGWRRPSGISTIKALSKRDEADILNKTFRTHRPRSIVIDRHNLWFDGRVYKQTPYEVDRLIINWISVVYEFCLRETKTLVRLVKFTPREIGRSQRYRLNLFVRILTAMLFTACGL